VTEKLVFSLNYRNITKADVYIATAVRTAMSLKSNDKKMLKILYMIQGFENWGVTDEKVYETYNYGFKNIVISNWLAERVRSCGAECTLIPNGFDFNYFSLRKPIEGRDRYRVSMLYHSGKRKGCDDGIKALLIVKKKYPQLTAAFFGVPERPDNLPEWIEYYQQPDKETHNNIYNHSAIYLAPSLQEGWGLTVGEAMICGAAVVCTDTLGFKEMVTDGVTGLISPISDPQKLAENMMRLLDDDNLRKQIATAGNTSIQRFTWDKSLETFCELIESKE
jgi:glycosyltransferase involved in cell wall biosynthesis